MIVASMYATFFDPGRDSEEVMRGWLVQDGWDAVGNHLFLGTGATYRDSSNIVARYQSLRGAGVTESGILDFAISYGVPAATLLVISALLAASGKKIFQTWPAVLLIVLTGSLAFAGSLSSFLGSILFWCSLIYCQRDEGVIMMQVMDQDHGKGLQPDRQITPSLEGVG